MDNKIKITVVQDDTKEYIETNCLYMIYKGEMYEKNKAYSLLKKLSLKEYTELKSCIAYDELSMIKGACCQKHAIKILETLIKVNKEIISKQEKILEELDLEKMD